MLTSIYGSANAQTQDIDICPPSTTVAEQEVQQDIEDGINDAQQFFARHGVTLDIDDEPGCTTLDLTPVYDEINDAAPDSGYDAHDYRLSHDTTEQATVQRYPGTIEAAVEAAKDAWTQTKLPSSEAERRKNDVVFAAGVSTLGSAYKPDTIELQPYISWVDAGITASDHLGVTSASFESYQSAKIGMDIAHEVLHKQGLPHREDWKDRYARSPTTYGGNVMGTGLPRRYIVNGDTTDFTYTMSDVQEDLLHKALNDTTDYHAVLRDHGPTAFDEFIRLWERDYPDVSKDEYAATPQGYQPLQPSVNH